MKANSLLFFIVISFISLSIYSSSNRSSSNASHRSQKSNPVPIIQSSITSQHYRQYHHQHAKNISNHTFQLAKQ
jgi:hypothetical protein